MTITLNINLVKQSLKNKEIGNLSWFLYFKFKYANSTIYQFSYSAAAKRMGCTAKSMKKYMDRFIEFDWCYRDGDNIHCRTMSEICGINGIEDGLGIDVNIEGLAREIALQIKRSMLQRNVSGQNDRIDRDKNRHAKEMVAGETLPGGLDSVATITTHLFSSILHISRSAAQRLKVKFSEKGWFEFIKRKRILESRVTFDDFCYKRHLDYIFMPVWWYEGCIFLRLPCEVRIAQPI